uniref:Macaca fascicularis brain cDNA clone: QflA-22540, similar to human serine (or cysteine) proteinase inhibitor, clade B(ovalbumin), member 9 (SERPINB9), mRNA, RefSeq: NM_004155.3 n=1 Tax=Macaca fascicularis TaxID=9541 RepID=I7GDH9_MACFA|nr:unnamed protein product [Macaca fascicularis]
MLPLKPVRESVLPRLFLASGGHQESWAFLGLQLHNWNLCLHSLCVSLCLP